jgi:hypothetical protein
MSYANGPRIVTDGLVCCLDAANRKSYAGSGSAWNDLSGNNNHATLFASPTYDTNNKGSISFNGSTQYAEVTTRNTNLEFQPTVAFSCFLFIKSLPSGENDALISNMYNDGTTYPGWDIWWNNSSTANTISSHFISSWSSNAIKVHWTYNYSFYANKWVSIALTYDGSCPTNSTQTLSSVNLYLDGILTTAGKAIATSNANGFNASNETISYNSSQRFRVSSRWSSGGIERPSDFQAGSILLYNNKQLSANEIKQNYDALKGRYGL